MTYFQYGPFSLFRSRAEAVQLATDRGTRRWLGREPEPPDRLQRELSAIQEVEIAAEPLYNQGGCGGWSLWSDSQLRRQKIVEVYRPVVDGQVCPFLMDRTVPIDTGDLTPAAAHFIASSHGSDSHRPDWLGQVRDVLATREMVVGGDRGVWARRRIIRYQLRLASGERTVYVFEVGYSEGYLFDVCDSWQEAKTEFQPPPCPRLECLECGARYTEPGNVEWGGMGCRRCNR